MFGVFLTLSAGWVCELGADGAGCLDPEFLTLSAGCVSELGADEDGMGGLR